MAKKVVKKNTQIQRFWGPFWGPFGSGHAVLSPLKLNLKWGPLKIVILTASGNQKTQSLKYLFDAHLVDFEDDWDKQCTEINVLFSSVVDVISAVLLERCW